MCYNILTTNREGGEGGLHEALRRPDLSQSGDAIIYTAECLRNVTWKSYCVCFRLEAAAWVQDTGMCGKLFGVVLTYGTEQQWSQIILTFQHAITTNTALISIVYKAGHSS